MSTPNKAEQRLEEASQVGLDRAKPQSVESRGSVEEITEEQWYYFLEVLPPVYMNRALLIDGKPIRASFGFAEGRELITAYWTKKGDHYFRQLTNEINPCW